MNNQMNYSNMMSINPLNSSCLALTRVTGIDGAKAYQMPPNSTVALFDNNEDLMYIKITDGAGFPTIRTFTFSEVLSNSTSSNSDYITRDEFNKLKEELLNGKQSISESKSNNARNKSSNNQSSKGNDE